MNFFPYIYVAKRTDRLPKQSNYYMHLHDNYEIFCFLSGDAKYAVEGVIYPLFKNDIMVMRRSESHRLVLLSDKTYRRIIVSFTLSENTDGFLNKIMEPFEERELGKFNRYPASLFPNSNLPYYLERICNTTDKSIQTAYLTVFLKELSEQFAYLKSTESAAQTNKCAEILRYINCHLTEPLSLQALSERFFISKSQLNRNFKQVVGTTIWEYIVEKRVLLAKNLLEKGEKPVNVYLLCGFGDYTSFYRAYNKKFGIPPSETKKLI